MRLLLTEDLLVLVGAGALAVGVVLLLVHAARLRRRPDDAPVPAAATAVPPGHPHGPEHLAAAPAAGDPPSIELDRPADAAAPPVDAPAGRVESAVDVAAHEGPDRPTPDRPAPDGMRRRIDGAAGSSRTVAAAVAQAFAVRAAARRAGLPMPRPGIPEESPTPAAPGSSPRPAPAAPRAPHAGGLAAARAEPERPAESPTPVRHALGREDAKDRLLAALLADPALALDATVAMDACRARLERLSGAAPQEHAGLREALQRLVGAGLRPDQLTRLAGLPLDEVQEMLSPEPSGSHG